MKNVIYALLGAAIGMLVMAAALADDDARVLLWIVIALSVLVGAAILAVLLRMLKLHREGICPVCLMQQFFGKSKFTMDLPEEPYNNGVALTPPMGWSSWNTFRERIDEDIIRETAEAMKKSGLVDAGYVYLNLDDCWQSSARDDKGRLQGDLNNFPSGIPKLVKHVNSYGMKLGLYTSNGTLTCEDLPASLGNETTDALTFALWGVEFFKYDFCHNIPISPYAPYIEGITLGVAGQKAFLTQYAAEAQLTDHAKIIKDKKLPSGAYIGFLGQGRGKASFTVSVEYEGEYVLTLLIKKALRKDKYIQIHINDRDMYEEIVPRTKTWSATGRHQLKVRLRQGENKITMFNPVITNADSAYVQYKRMGKALKQATHEVAVRTNREEKPIVYSICEWGWRAPWHWGAQAGNMWRTTPDIFPNWTSVNMIYKRTIGLSRYGGPGRWNDPDMLEVGNGKLTSDENKAHFSLWCMMAAPLVLGNDVRKFLNEDGSVDKDNDTLKIVTNKALIAIDQDVLGIPAKRVKKGLRTDILARPLSNGDIAVCIFNKSKMAYNTIYDISALAAEEQFQVVPESTAYNITELWTGEEQSGNLIKASLAGHSCKVYRVSRTRS